MAVNAMFGVAVNTSSAIMGQTGLSAVMGQTLAGGSSFPQGDVFNEDFRTGYENIGWVETNNPTDGATPPGTPPATLPASSLRTNTSGTSYATYTFATNTTATRYWRWWLYVSAESLADGNAAVIVRCENIIGDAAFAVRIRKNAPNLTLSVTGSAGFGAETTITTSTWYRCIVTWVNNSTGGSSFDVYNIAGSLIGSVAFDTDASAMRVMMVGLFTNTGSVAVDSYIAGLGIDSVGPLDP